MRKTMGFVCALAMAIAASGCAVNSAWIPQPVWRAAATLPVVEGLRAQQSGEPWLNEARRAIPAGCTVMSLKVITESTATFSYACFQNEA